VVITLITIIQIGIYDRGQQRVSKICIILSSIGLASIAVIAIITATGKVRYFNWLWFLYYLSLVKLVISFIKYCPQVYLNFRRKSTVGWNIVNVLLDFSGGLLSVAQLVFDSWRKNNWDGITGDPVKFGLGFISMVFDLIFMFQHYVLYKNSNSWKKNEYQHIDEEEDRIFFQSSAKNINSLHKNYNTTESFTPKSFG